MIGFWDNLIILILCLLVFIICVIVIKLTQGKVKYALIALTILSGACALGSLLNLPLYLFHMPKEQNTTLKKMYGVIAEPYVNWYRKFRKDPRLLGAQVIAGKVADTMDEI